MRRTSEMTPICKHRRKASGVTNPADTWILDCQPPQLWGSEFCCFSHQDCYFVMAANWWGCLLFIPMQMSRDSFGCHNSRDTTGICWVEARDAVLLKILQCTGQAPCLLSACSNQHAHLCVKWEHSAPVCISMKITSLPQREILAPHFCLLWCLFLFFTNSTIEFYTISFQY